MGMAKDPTDPLLYPWQGGLFCGKNLVGTTELVRQNVPPPRNVPGQQRDRMALSPENYLSSHVAHHTRNRATLIQEISNNRGVVAHQDETLAQQLGQKGCQGQNNGFHL